MTELKQKKKTRILLFGFINLNVMDGSAVFLSGITTMLSMSPDLEIDIVLANGVRRDLLVRPLIDLPNVNVISPYEEPDLISSAPAWLEKNQMTHNEASKVVQYYWDKADYDWFFIRGLEVAEELLKLESSILKSTLLYVTGITHENQVLPKEKYENLEKLFDISAYLLCQTDEMKQFLIKKFTNVQIEKVITLNPMIPDTTPYFEDVFEKREDYNRLCYTGKFDVGWNSIPIVIAFRELREDHPSLTLEIAGDKFNYRKDDRYFVNDLKYLLSNTENLTWYGAISRNQARNLIINSDIGITWRDKSMDASLELSTKLLEYGSLGKPAILNPTAMHKRLFGEDYPLYAESIDDFIEVIDKIQKDPLIYEIAAKRMFDVSQNFTYTKTLNKLLPFLSKDKRYLKSFFTKNGFICPSVLEDNFFHGTINELLKINLVSSKSGKLSPDSVCIIKPVSAMADVKSLFTKVSELGKIVDSLIFDNISINIISKNIGPTSENFLYNINYGKFEELLANISHQTYIRNVQNGKNSSNQRTISLPEEELISYQPVAVTSGNSNNTELFSELNLQKKEYKKLEKKYNALMNSKLGKLTVKYWGLKRKLKS